MVFLMLVCTCSQTEEDFGMPYVLVSARIELIFFLVAGIVLCFGFSVRRMLITH